MESLQSIHWIRCCALLLTIMLASSKQIFVEVELLSSEGFVKFATEIARECKVVQLYCDNSQHCYSEQSSKSEASS